MYKEDLRKWYFALDWMLPGGQHDSNTVLNLLYNTKNKSIIIINHWPLGSQVNKMFSYGSGLGDVPICHVQTPS